MMITSSSPRLSDSARRAVKFSWMISGIDGASWCTRGISRGSR
jgi:hypothetical protein